MNQSIHGVFLCALDYSDNSLIINCLTLEYGKQSFLWKGAKQKNKRIPLIHLQSIQITSNFNPNKNLNTCYKIEILSLPVQISSDIRKSTQVLFIAELLDKTTPENETNSLLFNFIKHFVNCIEQELFESSSHLLFTIEYCMFLGIYPISPKTNDQLFFNPIEGVFEPENNLTSSHLNQEESSLLFQAITQEKQFVQSLNKTQRNKLTSILVKYIQTQMGLKPNAIKSHEILQMVFQ